MDQVRVIIERGCIAAGAQQPVGATLALFPLDALQVVESGKGRFADASSREECMAARRQHVAALLRAPVAPELSPGPWMPWRQ